MTQTLDPSTATDPQQRVGRWLGELEEALAARDVQRASGMFAATCFWRDLIAFSWNITTVEHTLEATDPRGFATSEPPPATTSTSASPTWGPTAR